MEILENIKMGCGYNAASDIGAEKMEFRQLKRQKSRPTLHVLCHTLLGLLQYRKYIISVINLDQKWPKA